MPSYKVLSAGFFNSQLYSPTGKRRVLTTDKPFKKVPSWLEPIKGETAKEAQIRKAKETKAANAAKKKAEEDAKEIETASFIGKTTETL